MTADNASSLLPVIDIHTHLAGLGQGGTGCFIDPRKFESLLYRLLRRKLGIYKAHLEQKLDEAYLERLKKDVTSGLENGALQAAVLFPHERIYLDSGEPAEQGQEVFVPNDYTFACAENSDGCFLPAMSIHPYRKDAFDEAEKWIERGAVAMKWLPNSQGMNPADPRTLKMFDLLAARKIPLISHTGGEHTVTVRWPELGNPEALLPALERGVTVIMAHCGTQSGLFDKQWIPQFFRLARTYPHCWGDTSAFNTPGRARWMSRFLREEGIVDKLVHGSDYPVPPSPWWSLQSLGFSKARKLAAIWSYLERDIRIKQERGFPEIVFTNTARVLGDAALKRWRVRAGRKS